MSIKLQPKKFLGILVKILEFTSNRTKKGPSFKKHGYNLTAEK